MGKELTPKYYNQHMKKYRRKEFLWERLYNRVVDFLPKPENTKLIIDLGCGVGGLAEVIYKNGYRRYIGIDFSDTSINISKERVPEYEFYKEDIRDKKIVKYFEDDIVFISTEVLEHIKDDLIVVERIPHRSLFIFSVPNKDHSSHVRFFRNHEEVEKRYKNLLSFTIIDDIEKIKKPGQIMFLSKTERR